MDEIIKNISAISLQISLLCSKYTVKQKKRIIKRAASSKCQSNWLEYLVPCLFNYVHMF
jgi:hypothetical protein